MPECAVPMLVRRLLWRDYGVSIPDMEFEDVMLAIEIDNAEKRRIEAQRRRES